MEHASLFRIIGRTLMMGGALALLVGARILMAPGLPPSDMPGFATMGGGALALMSGGTLETLTRTSARGPRLALWLMWATWSAGYFAVLVLAYKDNSAQEWRDLAGFPILIELIEHLLVWPAELALGASLQFVDPHAPFYVLACLVASLLAAYVLWRRPRRPSKLRDLDAVRG